MTPLKALILAVATLAGTAALAHSDEYLDTRTAPNGGQLRMAGNYHFELVVAKDSKEAKENPVIVYVTDHAETKVSTVGAGGTATILSGKGKLLVKLAPDGDNRLKGVGVYRSAPDLKAVVSVTLPGKVVEQARFTPLAVAADSHADHKH